MKNIYQLKLHETLVIESMYNQTVERVPGGWIYYRISEKSQSAVFVPFNSEFYGDTNGK